MNPQFYNAPYYPSAPFQPPGSFPPCPPQPMFDAAPMPTYYGSYSPVSYGMPPYCDPTQQYQPVCSK